MKSILPYLAYTASQNVELMRLYGLPYPEPEPFGALPDYPLPMLGDQYAPDYAMYLEEPLPPADFFETMEQQFMMPYLLDDEIFDMASLPDATLRIDGSLAPWDDEEDEDSEESSDDEEDEEPAPRKRKLKVPQPAKKAKQAITRKSLKSKAAAEDDAEEEEVGALVPTKKANPTLKKAAQSAQNRLKSTIGGL